MSEFMRKAVGRVAAVNFNTSTSSRSSSSDGCVYRMVVCGFTCLTMRWATEKC